jgi:YD repeat-containing protein
MTSGDDGLMNTFTDPRGGVETYTYDSLGRLTKAQDPAGGFTALARTGKQLPKPIPFRLHRAYPTIGSGKCKQGCQLWLNRLESLRFPTG